MHTTYYLHNMAYIYLMGCVNGTHPEKSGFIVMRSNRHTKAIVSVTHTYNTHMDIMPHTIRLTLFKKGTKLGWPFIHSVVAAICYMHYTFTRAPTLHNILQSQEVWWRYFFRSSRCLASYLYASMHMNGKISCYSPVWLTAIQFHTRDDTIQPPTIATKQAQTPMKEQNPPMNTFRRIYYTPTPIYSCYLVYTYIVHNMCEYSIEIGKRIEWGRAIVIAMTMSVFIG